MILLKVFLLQAFWFAVVLFGGSVDSLTITLVSILLVVLNFIFFSPDISPGRYFALTIFFVLFGYLHDSSLVWLNIILEESYKVGFLSLWIVFISYYGDIFNKLKNIPAIPLALLGGTGGALSYWSANKLGALSIVPGSELAYISLPFIYWAFFFPISIRLFYNDEYWNNFLDKTIFFSFDRSGFHRHKNKFSEDILKNNLFSKNGLVTGGTSGIGGEVASTLSILGASVYVTGRDKEKGKSFVENNANSVFTSLDMANWSEVDDFCKNSVSFDYVVLNAGGMPEKILLNDYGVEYQCASQLLGHYYLISLLKKYKKLNHRARIVWVSSGGMYLTKLNVENLFKNINYEKVSTYANVKRAQITLVEEIAKQDEWKDFFINSMHPGWVKTEGLRDALPGFYDRLSQRLRKPGEGADTVLWLLISNELKESGGFFFDRKKVLPYFLKSFNPSKQQREMMLDKISIKMRDFL